MYVNSETNPVIPRVWAFLLYIQLRLMKKTLINVRSDREKNETRIKQFVTDKFWIFIGDLLSVRCYFTWRKTCGQSCSNRVTVVRRLVIRYPNLFIARLHFCFVIENIFFMKTKILTYILMFDKKREIT